MVNKFSLCRDESLALLSLGFDLNNFTLIASVFVVMQITINIQIVQGSTYDVLGASPKSVDFADSRVSVRVHISLRSL